MNSSDAPRAGHFPELSCYSEKKSAQTANCYADTVVFDAATYRTTDTADIKHETVAMATSSEDSQASQAPVTIVCVGMAGKCSLV